MNIEYEKLKNEAIKNPSQKNLKRLGEWFKKYECDLFYDGESYEVNEDLRLFPIYAEEPGKKVLGYELKGNI